MHVWLAGQPALDLIVTLDDATSAIYSAFLIEEEGTASTFRALTEVFGSHGLPMSLYTDRGAHYFYTPTAGGEVDHSRPTQVGRALERLGVEHIAAYSPQARGRSERVFHTLQDRLVKELALKEIDTVEALPNPMAVPAPPCIRLDKKIQTPMMAINGSPLTSSVISQLVFSDGGLAVIDTFFL